ncbi:MAG: hypothetical protein WCB67_16195 [Solirubrobacteraceae bacterium]
MSLALAAGAPTAALAAGTTVSVRVEGLTKTLLATKVVQTHSGAIRTGGTPAGACPATTAAGALDVATAHRWSGTYGTYGLSVTQIFGETHTFTSKDYWSIWVDNKFATAGICSLKLHRGEHLLFAAVPIKGTEFPIVISGPKHAAAGRSFTLKVSYINAKGAVKPVAGARVHGSGASGVTNAAGTVSVTATHKGMLAYTAAKTGFIRSAAVTVRVG